MGYVWLTAAMWMGLGLLASVLSLWAAVSAALVEVFLGAVAANVVGLNASPWVDYLAGLGAIMLAFLAGTEIKWPVVRARALPNLTIGAGAFLAPFVSIFLFTTIVAGWTRPQALIGAIALSTTSVALVYAIISEEGQSQSEVGQIVLAARFINDIGTVGALAFVTAQYDFHLALFAAAMVIASLAVPRITPWVLGKLARAEGSADIRFIGVSLLVLGGLGSISGIEAVVPAYLIGIALSPVLEAHRGLADRLRTVTFAWFTPFYFLRAGSFLDFTGWSAIAAMASALFAIKIISKCGAIVPLTRLFGFAPRDGWSIALLMSTGLTFGTVTAFVGLARGMIDQHQYAILVMSVIASGAIPALIAQRMLRARHRSDPKSDPRSAVPVFQAQTGRERGGGPGQRYG
jgi:Kef-type K+ transport system membrane component KefB